MILSHLKAGESAQIKNFHQISNDVRKKLMVMGLLPNTTVTLIRRAPMGDPIQIYVRGVSLAIRENVADNIEVEVK